jgi:hypothetical protein
MKRLTYIGIILFLIAFSGADAYSQNCTKFHLYGTCMQYPGAGYKMDGQSRSNTIGVGDKLVYNVIFYGDRSYKLIFCATDLFNPVHYVLLDSETRELIYDSKKDDYSETIELTIENTRRIMIEISVLALNADAKTTENFFGCVGFLMNYRPLKK